MIQFTRKLVVCTGLLSGFAAISKAQEQPSLPPLPPPATMRAIPLPGVKPALPPAAVPTVPSSNVQPVVALSSAPVTNGPAPKIQFASTIYDFGKVLAGDPVKFSYTFTNTGTKTLEVTGVHPQCGCTAAGEWTRKVEPGQTGVVPMQFNTASYPGQVFKTITVACNDPLQPQILLQVKGTIWKALEIIPAYTVMNILPDMPRATATIRITNNLEQPLEVMSPVCSLKGFEAELKTNTPGREYVVTLTALPPLTPGTTSGKVTVKTSATNTPSLDIPFWANVQAPIMVLPPQVLLPAGVLKSKVSPSVTIQNNTTNALTVSDPVVNDPSVEVQIRELQPGRIFSAQMSFPEGFEMKPGQQMLLTLKTSNRQNPELKIPIVQMPQPVLPQTSAVEPLKLRPKEQPGARLLTPRSVAAPPTTPAVAQ